MSTFFSALFATSIGCAAAQYVNNNTIGSCADVDCPSRGDSTNIVDCQVTNRTYSLIGLQSVPSVVIGEGENLTWTVGTHVYDITDGDSNTRKVEKDFYLGTPPSLDLSKDDLPYAGCAIFLYDNELTKPRDNQESCADLIGIDCLTSLLTDATAYFVDEPLNGTAGAEETCQHVQQVLNENFPTSCAKVSGKNSSWNRIESILMTGNGAPKPPSPSANQSSTCHPTLPKSNELSFFFGYNDTGTFWYNSTYSMLYSVDLVLSMFWSPNSTAQGALSMPDSHFTCLWPVDLNNEQLEGMEPNTAAHSKRISPFILLAILAIYLL